MAYFRNTAVNWLNLHYGIHAVAVHGGGAFFGVYLLKAGVALPVVLLSLAAILAGRFIIRPIIVPLAVRYGIKPLLIAGTLITGLQFPLLAEVGGVGPALFMLCFVASLSDTFYWTTYHAYYAVLGDDEHRGHQLGVREALVAIVGIVSPLATGVALVTLGPRVAFGAVAIAQILSAVPFFWTPNVAVARHVPGALKASLSGILLFAADGWMSAGYLFAWHLALFRSLGENFVSFGGALAAAALIGALAGIVLGRHIDAGHGRKILWLAVSALAFTIVLRAVAVGNAPLAVAANAIGALVACLYTPTLMTAVYNLAKRSPCPLRFHVATEGGWDAGGAFGCLFAALLIGLELSLPVAIIPALVGVAASIILLRRYYA
jgi:DHA1 family inner membrane transport protein